MARLAKSCTGPDYEALADSGDFRFQSIDSKLLIALPNMVENAGEVASEAKIRIRQRSPELGKKGSADGQGDLCNDLRPFPDNIT